MRYLQAAVTAASLVFAVAQAASAADMPVKAAPAPIAAPAYNWTGFYLGVAGGYGWGRSKQSLITGGATSGDYNQSGGLIGGTIGYNYQFAQSWVLGVEADWSWAHIDGTPFLPGICAGNTCFTNLHSFGTLRPRVGFAWDRWMVFATGGLAWGHAQAGQDSCTPATLCGTRDETGWTVGGGVEAFVIPKLSVKVEYLYADFGDHVFYNPGIAITVPEKVNIVRGGINYHF